MKKILSLMALALVTIGAWADTVWSSTTNGVYLTCETTTGNYVRVKEINFAESNVTAVTIPHSFEKDGKTYTVTTIGIGGALSTSGSTSKEAIKTLTIEDGIQTIAGWAFNEWTGLTEVNLPSSLTEIGGCAFNNCSSLTAINIPNSVETLGEKVFSGCTSLTSITFNSVPNNFGWGCVSNNSDNQGFNSNTTVYAPYNIMKVLKDKKLKDYSGEPTYKVFNVLLEENMNIDDLLVNMEISDNKITLNRTLHGGHWNTMCLPFYLSSDNIAEAFGSDTKVVTFDGCKDNVMNFKQVWSVEKCTPFMVWLSKDKSSITLSYNGWVNDDKGNITQNPNNEGYCMVGNLNGDKQFVPDRALFIANDQVYKSVGKSPIKAMSAYFTIPSNASTPEAKYSFSIDGTITGINGVSADSVQKEDAIYDLQGNRVTNPAKGIYIQKGRKVIFK